MTREPITKEWVSKMAEHERAAGDPDITVSASTGPAVSADELRKEVQRLAWLLNNRSGTATWEETVEAFLQAHTAEVRRAALEEAARRVETAPESLSLFGRNAFAEHVRALASQPLPGKKEGEG